jgi:hypothetical protein
MGNKIKTGSKRPKTKDRMLASGQLPPLPKMYQMGIAKGVEQERKRIVKSLEKDICADSTLTCCDGACRAYKDAIALIEGKSNG